MRDFMKKFSAGIWDCSLNTIEVEDGNTSSLDQWNEIAAAWRAAGKPTPSDFKHFDSEDYGYDLDIRRCVCFGNRYKKNALFSVHAKFTCMTI